MSRRRLYFAIGAMALLPLPALAAAAVPEISNSTPEQYQQCIAAIDKKPDDALEQALYWKDHGGGVPAGHCAALALIAMKQPVEAAMRLDQLAHDAEAGDAKNRAALLDQAGNAWLLAGQPEDAEASFSAALALTPSDVDVLIDRSRARAMKKNWVGAESDLTRAAGLDSTRPDVLVLRASAREAEGRKADAKADIDAALKLNPSFPDALVERGAMKLAAGDKRGARADWAHVLAQSPDSPAGESARKYIEDLEINPAANTVPAVPDTGGH